MPEVGESVQFDADVVDFFAKFSYDAEVAEHFQTMEVPGLDMQTEIETTTALMLSDSALGDAGATCLGKVGAPSESCMWQRVHWPRALVASRLP